MQHAGKPDSSQNPTKICLSTVVQSPATILTVHITPYSTTHESAHPNLPFNGRHECYQLLWSLSTQRYHYGPQHCRENRTLQLHLNTTISDNEWSILWILQLLPPLSKLELGVFNDIHISWEFKVTLGICLPMSALPVITTGGENIHHLKVFHVIYIDIFSIYEVS